MRAIVVGSTKHFLLAAFYGALGIVIAFLCLAVWTLTNRPDLSIWHKTHLKSEYHQLSPVKTFPEYLELEKRLFAEVEQKIYQNYQSTTPSPLNRYVRHSLSDPGLWKTDWNRSYEWPNDDAEFGVLLLHGMSDSPYTLSHIAEHYKQQGYVLGLRLPGHGTIPSGLTKVTWPDLAGAVSLAIDHMEQKLNGKPLYVIGYSTGAALALNHELERIIANKPTSFTNMVFISPAVGLRPIAAGAYWQAMMGEMIGQEKLYWNSIQTEYDPFKYQSFAVNAGDVVYQLTLRNLALMRKLSAKQKANIPSILTFQSLVDDTVSSSAIVEFLYQELPDNHHELVLFDINRTNSNNQLIDTNPFTPLASFWDNKAFSYRLSLVENNFEKQNQVQVRDVANQTHEETITPLLLAWPEDVYSLSHVALSFPIEDSLYGPITKDKSSTIQIGRTLYQGERGLFSVPAAEILRQKWNPFYPYMMSRIDEVIQ